MKAMLSLAVIALMLTLAILALPEGKGEAAAITVTYSEKPSNFDLTVMGGSFSFNDTHPVSKGTLWTVKANIREDGAFINDGLKINGSVRHGSSATSTFNFSINAAGPLPPPVTLALSHGSHTDNITANLTFIATASCFGRVHDITSYELTVTGQQKAGLTEQQEAGAPTFEEGIGLRAAGPGGGCPVGGIAELPDAAVAPLDVPESSGLDAGVVVGLGGAALAGAIALGGGAWYARRRWRRAN